MKSTKSISQFNYPETALAYCTSDFLDEVRENKGKKIYSNKNSYLELLTTRAFSLLSYPRAKFLHILPFRIVPSHL
jgi:hypothetical protein